MEEQFRSRLPEKMRPLATNVPAGSQWLFGDDLNKRIAQISRMNNALSQTLNGLINSTGS